MYFRLIVKKGDVKLVITHKLAMNLEGKERTPWIEVSQWDAYTRQIRLLLLEGKTPWEIPEDVTVVIRYQRPDGTRGAYDTLPNGEQAWQVQDHALTLTLAPQVVTVAGTVMLYATIFREEAVLTTFAVKVCVHPAEQDHGNDDASENLLVLTGVLPAPEKAEIGQYIRVLEVNADGKVVRLETADMPEAGVDEEQVRKIVDDYNQENPPASTDAVLYTDQTLSEAQKTQARANIDAAGKNISWADLGEEEVVFFEGTDVTFTDDGVIFESNGTPLEGDFVTVEFDGVSGVYEVTEIFGSLSIEADGMGVMYVDGITYVFADDITQPHSVKMTGKVVTRVPDRYAAEPCARFYIDQFGNGCLSFDVMGNNHITKEDLKAAIATKPVIISLGNSEFYFPVEIDPYDGENTYGSVTIIKADGTTKTYYTSEYMA